MDIEQWDRGSVHPLDTRSDPAPAPRWPDCANWHFIFSRGPSVATPSTSAPVFVNLEYTDKRGRRRPGSRVRHFSMCSTVHLYRIETRHSEVCMTAAGVLAVSVHFLSSNFHVCNGRADGTQETNGHKYFLLFLLTEGQLRETESRAQAGRVKT